MSIAQRGLFNCFYLPLMGNAHNVHSTVDLGSLLFAIKARD